MNYATILFATGLVVIVVCAFLFVRVMLDMKQRVLITVARPTTADGETVQVSANIRATAGALEIADHIEKASLAIQGRVARQNEIVAETDAKVAHQKWLRIRAKLDEAAKERRTGLGVLTKAERAWWNAHAKDFDANGPLVKPERVAEAARGSDEDPIAAEG